MDDIVVRPRYPRYNVSGRRKRKNSHETGNLAEKVIKQAIICIVIFVLVNIIKNVDTPATKFVTVKIKNLLVEDINFAGIYESIDNLISKWKTGKSASDQEVAPASADVADGNETNGGGELGAGSSTNGSNINGSSIDSSKFKLLLPAAGNIGSPFGSRIHPITGKEEFHEGIDIEAANGSPIKAALDGVVTEAAANPSYGKYLKIKHANGIVTVYAHCSRLIAEKGQSVKQGDIIAMIGSTGASVGAHLHFEIWKDGKALNPMDYL